MHTALIVLGSIIGYFFVGYQVSAASWKAWIRKDPKSKTARFFFPYDSRFRSGIFLGTRSGDAPASTVMVFLQGGGPEVALPERIATYKLLLALLFPVQIAYSLVAMLVCGLLSAWKGTISLLAQSERHKLLGEAPGESACLGEPVKQTDPGREYLMVVGRRKELLVEMDALDVKQAELTARLGGPDEAKKLVAMPGKIL